MSTRKNWIETLSKTLEEYKNSIKNNTKKRV